MPLSAPTGGIISIILGLCSGLYLVWTLIRHHASRGWSTVEGKILESNLDEDSDGFAPHVRYAYSVEGESYTSERLYSYTPNRSSEQDARKHLTPYPVGKAVSVYYHPRKPADALLDRHTPLWRHLFWLSFTLFWIVLGVEMLRGG